MHVCMCMCMWVCVMCMPHTWKGPEDLLEMELQGVWATCFGFWELNLGLFTRELKAFNHWAMSLAQLFTKQSQCSQCCLFYFSICFLIYYLLLSRGMCYSTYWKSEDNLLHWFSPSTMWSWEMNSNYQVWWHMAASNQHQGMQKIHECGHSLGKILVYLGARTHMVAHKYL